MTDEGPLGFEARASELVAAALARARSMFVDKRADGERRRHAFISGSRAFVELRALRDLDRAEVEDALRRSLKKLPGVADILALGASGFLVISLDTEDAAGLDEIVEAVELAEDTVGASGAPFAGSASHPADPDLLFWQGLNLTADLCAIALSGVGRAFGLPQLPVELPTLISVLTNIPPVRRALREHQELEAALVFAHAAGQVAAQGSIGLATDAARRGILISELLAEREVWRRHEPHLLHALEDAELPARPELRLAPPVESSFERWEKRALLASIGLGTAVLASSGDLRRAADVALAGIPRPAVASRDAFAAVLGLRLARHGTVVISRHVLRNLEVVDRLVIDVDSLLGEEELGSYVALPGENKAQLVQVASHLLRHPGELSSWALEQLPPNTKLARGLARQAMPPQATVRALVKDKEVVALFEIRRSIPRDVQRLLSAARRIGIDAMLAGGDQQLAERLGGLGCVPGGRRLATSIRLLQEQGHAVLAVAARPTTGLDAADVGVGLYGRRRRNIRPDLICPSLGSVAEIVDAVGLARTANRRALLTGLLGSGAGVGALTTDLLEAPQAFQALNFGSLIATAIGAGTATQLRMRREVQSEAPAWHALGVEEVFARISSDAEGLSTSTAEARRSERPRGTIPAPLRAVVEELANPLTAVLGAGALASGAIGSALDAGLIASVLGLNAVAGALQKLRTERSIERLSRQFAHGSMTALRDGTAVSVPAAELVVGDVVRLEAGDVLLGDCRLISANQLEIDESALTGESLPVVKSPEPIEGDLPLAERRSMLYAGSSVAAGSALAVVVATGDNIEALADLDPGATPPLTGVGQRLRTLTRRTVPVVLASGAGLVGEGLLRGQPLAETVSAGISLSTAAVPEGLPFVATAAQTAAAKRLSTRGVIVSNPNVLEALGRVDVFCFDKTGTLTEGHLALVEVADTKGSAPLDSLKVSQREVLAAALRATPRARRERLPHPTDQAIVDGGRRAGVAEDLGLENWRRRRSLAFEPRRGYHATLGFDESRLRLSVKGAPEVVLARCSKWRDPKGQDRSIDVRARHRLGDRLEALARRGLRILAVAEGFVAQGMPLRDESVTGLVFLGFVAIGDTARASAETGLVDLPPGVQVMMITGDHPSTATWIAEELGLLNGSRVLSGPELERLDDAALEALLGDLHVVARATPAMKVRIIQALQRTGRVVAMTGDGANDAQAIRLADVGIAFGPHATAAARATADLVATGESLDVIVAALAEGRAMWASVREALGVLLGGNLGEAAFTLGAALITGSSPLTARQLLAVNLFTDLAPALALAVQPAPGRAAKESPEVSLGGALARSVTIRASATAAGAALAWITASLTGSPGRARTVALAALVGGQLGQTALAGRTSALTLASTAVSAAGLVAIIETPGVNTFFDCRPLGPIGWSLALLGSATATCGAALADRLIRPARSGLMHEEAADTVWSATSSGMRMASAGM